MKENYRKQLEWWFAEFQAEQEVDHYLALFPELKGKLSKFGIGIYRWCMTGEIDLENEYDVSRVRLLLNFLDDDYLFHYFGNTFNEASIEDVCKYIVSVRKKPT